MIKTGKIQIIDGIIKFEYYELEKPDKKTYDKAKLYNFENLIIQKYEASKLTVEVSNDCRLFNDGQILPCISSINETVYGKNNQHCKAEVNGTAKIIELIK